MAFAVVHSRALDALQAQAVTVEVQLANGLPSFALVGLADTEVKESRCPEKQMLLHRPWASVPRKTERIPVVTRRSETAVGAKKSKPVGTPFHHSPLAALPTASRAPSGFMHTRHRPTPKDAATHRGHRHVLLCHAMTEALSISQLKRGACRRSAGMAKIRSRGDGCSEAPAYDGPLFEFGADEGPLKPSLPEAATRQRAHSTLSGHLAIEIPRRKAVARSC